MWSLGNYSAGQGPQAVINFLNEPAIQGPGQVGADILDDGSVKLLYFGPGDATSGKFWEFQSFTAAQGPQGAVNWLNEGAVQGPGEASAVLRDDGSVGIFALVPGSESHGQTWEYLDFDAAQGLQGVVNWLNEPMMQGPGEASVVGRDDGSVGLFALSPGSGAAGGRWAVANFPAADGGLQAAVEFLNANGVVPMAGTATGFVRDDGSVALVYLTHLPT